MVTRALAKRIMEKVSKRDLTAGGKEKSLSPLVRDVYEALMLTIKEDLQTKGLEFFNEILGPLIRQLGQFNVQGVGRLFVRNTKARQIFVRFIFDPCNLS